MATMEEQPEFGVFKTILLHCLVIIALPVISFFASKALIFDGILGLSNVASNVYAAVVAVVLLHVAFGSFIYKAYFATPQKTLSKAD